MNGSGNRSSNGCLIIGSSDVDLLNSEAGQGSYLAGLAGESGDERDEELSERVETPARVSDDGGLHHFRLGGSAGCRPVVSGA